MAFSMSFIILFQKGISFYTECWLVIVVFFERLFINDIQPNKSSDINWCSWLEEYLYFSFFGWNTAPVEIICFFLVLIFGSHFFSPSFVGERVSSLAFCLENSCLNLPKKLLGLCGLLVIFTLPLFLKLVKFLWPDLHTKPSVATLLALMI